jgi:hypothetical protein
MRTALTVLTLAALVASVSACSLGGDEVSAKTREQEVVDTVTEAVPLVQEAVAASEATIDGKWSSCPGGVGHRFAGGGTVTAPEGDTAAQLEAVRAALTDAGFTDETKVDGHVTATRDEVSLHVEQPSGARGPGLWAVSFHGPCNRYGGDDEDYVKAQNLQPATILLPR